MWRSAEIALSEAILRLNRPDGTFAGTGFLVTPTGYALTCHHVVGANDHLQAIDSNVHRWIATHASADETSLSHCDIAILKLTPEGADPGITLPMAVPLSTSSFSSDFRTRVMLRLTPVAGAPLSGNLEGRTRVSYRATDTLSYNNVAASLIRGMTIERGMSGSPVWDDSVEAVVGLLAVGTDGDKNIGGFAIPFEAIADSIAFKPLLAENDAQIARFGTRPNLLAVRDVAAMVTRATLKQLEDRGRLLPDKIVSREIGTQILDEFLASEKMVLPIVGAAGQGKTCLLAQFASLRDRPVFFVRAAKMKAEEEPGAALDRMINESVSHNSTHFTKFSFLKNNVYSRSISPILLVDAINEIQLNPLHIATEWLPDLIGTSKDLGVKTVFTVRRELFRLIEQEPYSEGLLISHTTRRKHLAPQTQRAQMVHPWRL